LTPPAAASAAASAAAAAAGGGFCGCACLQAAHAAAALRGGTRRAAQCSSSGGLLLVALSAALLLLLAAEGPVFLASPLSPAQLRSAAPKDDKVFPCDGGFEDYVTSWCEAEFIHAVDVMSAVVRYTDPVLISAATIYAGATPEGFAAAASRPVFFVLDVESESNVGHWLMEFSVFLREWPDISATFPRAKILIGSEYSYKRRLFALFDIAVNSVALLADLPQENYCIFVPFQSIPNPAINVELFAKRWFAHVRYMQCASGINVREPVYNRARLTTPLDAALGPLVPTSVLVIPRGNKQNVRVSDRAYPGFEPLMQWAEDQNGRVLLVDKSADFRQQIRAVAAARIIIVTEGSAFYVTAAWALRSVVIVVGTALLEQIKVIRPLAVLHQAIVAVNNVSFVPSAADVVPLVMARFADELYR
jgi:hypothetical protein